MAKASKNNTSIILNFSLVLSLILMIITVAESRVSINAKSKASVTLVCDAVTAVAKGDTCFGIAKSNNLTIVQFDVFNPNLNCDGLFVGQWLCVDGFAS